MLTTNSDSACKVTPATPRFDRDAWTQHNNFPNHVLLLGSHKNFRSISKTLVTRASLLNAAPTEAWRDDTLYLFSWWQSGMKNHEHYEERKLYPFLCDRYCVSLGTLVGDHGEIDDQRHVVQKAIAGRGRDEIQTALRRFDEILVRHLRDEEDLVIPMLLDLPREAFQRYFHGSALTPRSATGPSDSSSCSDCR